MGGRFIYVLAVVLLTDGVPLKLNFARDTYRLEYLNYWQTLNLDIVICPVQPQTAAQLGTSKYWAYTSVCKLGDK